MKKLTLLLILPFLLSACVNKGSYKSQNNDLMGKSIYDFKVEDLSGEEFDFASLKGKKIMIVNTASKCGLTPQYEQLEEIYQTYGSDDFVVVGFPANNFMSQEPGSNGDIAEFCKLNYGVSFPMMSKISVRGKDRAPIYAFLTEKQLNGFQDSEVQWNFQKYLFDEDGNLVKVISPRTLPNDPEVIDWLKG